jgi:hypothetical protein
VNLFPSFGAASAVVARRGRRSLEKTGILIEIKALILDLNLVDELSEVIELCCVELDRVMLQVFILQSASWLLRLLRLQLYTYTPSKLPTKQRK